MPHWAKDVLLSLAFLPALLGAVLALLWRTYSLAAAEFVAAACLFPAGWRKPWLRRTRIAVLVMAGLGGIMALNVFRLSALARREGGRWRIEFSGWVSISYQRLWITLFKFKGKPFFIEEGLFGALQDLGWLHPYRAEWSWTDYL